MARTKDNAVVAVIGGLTRTQAANITKDIIRSKADNAPLGRGSIGICKNSNVGNMLHSGRRKAING